MYTKVGIRVITTSARTAIPGVARLSLWSACHVEMLVYVDTVHVYLGRQPGLHFSIDLVFACTSSRTMFNCAADLQFQHCLKSRSGICCSLLQKWRRVSGGRGV